MTAAALFLFGTEVVPIANDVPPTSPNRARALTLAPREATDVMHEANAEVLLYVERGSIEIMIGGAGFPLRAGETARVLPGAVFAWRTIGAAPACVSVARVPPAAHPDTPARTIAA